MKSLPLCLLLLIGDSMSAAELTPASFAYVLQADSLAKTKIEAVTKLAACGRDWLVLDANFSNGQPWTPADLATIRASHAGRKIIAYLSIGEAGTYRAYWHREWDANQDGIPDSGSPAFLLTQNPEWKENYRVKYWQAGWQKLILAEEDKILAAGFDGVYLDIVDGFETFEQNGENFIDDRLNPETKQSYRRDMVDWVKIVSARARKLNTAALVIPQNGTQLFAHPDFLTNVDAVGIEDLFTHGDKRQKGGHTQHILDCLAPAIAAHKPVFDIEYARNHELRAYVQAQAAQHDFVWTITDRPLKTLGNSGK